MRIEVKSVGIPAANPSRNFCFRFKKLKIKKMYKTCCLALREGRRLS